MRPELRICTYLEMCFLIGFLKAKSRLFSRSLNMTFPFSSAKPSSFGLFPKFSLYRLNFLIRLKEFKLILRAFQANRQKHLFQVFTLIILHPKIVDSGHSRKYCYILHSYILRAFTKQCENTKFYSCQIYIILSWTLFQKSLLINNGANKSAFRG